MSRHPQPIAEVLAALMAKRGYAHELGAAELTAAWVTAAGDLLAKHTRVGEIKRGTLEVIVANSVLMQEMTFQKQIVLDKLIALMPDQKIKNLRFKVGAIH
jgi:predicted nucleic acid-binding Zn ribbon protein